jgi:hypothetical protein
MYLFIGFTLLSLGGIMYFLTIANIRKIRDEWSTYRCNPLYMPMAFVVEDPGGFSAVAENFEHCMAMMSASVVSQINDAANSQFSLIAEALSAITNPLALFRQMFSMMNKFILSFTTTTLGKVSGPLSMFIYYLNKVQDLIRRMVGEGYIAAFFGITIVSAIEAFISLCLTIIKGFVYAMLIISIILALFQPEILAIVLVLASSLAAAGA